MCVYMCTLIYNFIRIEKAITAYTPVVKASYMIRMMRYKCKRNIYIYIIKIKLYIWRNAKSMLTKRKERCIKYDFKTVTFLIVHYSGWTVILEKALSQQWNVFFIPTYSERTGAMWRAWQEWNSSPKTSNQKVKRAVFSMFSVCICLPKVLFCFPLHRCAPDPQKS